MSHSYSLPFTYSCTGSRRTVITICTLVLSLFFFAMIASAQATSGAGQVGVWTVLPTASNMPVNPVHAALLHDGKVLVIEGKQTTPSPLGAIWDPATRTASVIDVPYTMFCSAMVNLPDGDPFIAGGTLQFHPPAPKFTGINKCATYNPTAGTFQLQPNMAEGRWYPTSIVLSDGTVMTFAGNDEAPDSNNTVEIFTPDPTTGIGSWSKQFVANWTPPLYPREHLLPDGRVFYSMSDNLLFSRFFDVSTKVWSKCCQTISNSVRVYGTAVLLPLDPANANDKSAKVIIMGGGQFDTTTHSQKTTEIISFPDSSPHWTAGPDMSEPRIQLNATILPSGRVLVTGGSDLNEDLNSVSFNADLYDPVANSFSSAGVTSVPRLYHSNAVLLPDATVITFGNNHPPAPFSPYDPRVELYQPAYLFKADGTLATRPVITGVPGTAIHYGATFKVTTPDAANISAVELIRPAGVTHAFNMEQRMIKLKFTVSTTAANTLDVIAPADGDFAPPGYYLLFILNKTSSATSTGTPSVAKFVQICPTTGCL